MIGPLETILSALERGGFAPRPSGPDAHESRCPVHQGNRRNLSITAADDGRVLVHCHHTGEGEGCDVEAIVSALGMSAADLFPHEHTSGPTPQKAGRPKGKLHATTDAAIKAARWGLRQAAKQGRSDATWETSGQWTYEDASGSVAFVVARFDNSAGEKQYRPIRPSDGGWRIGDPPGPLPLYRLRDLATADRIIVTEGERCADSARSLDFTGTTSAHGSKSAAKSGWGTLAGKDLVILPDHDAPGENYAKAVVTILAKLEPPPKVRIVRLPGLDDGDDLVDWLVGRDPIAARAELDGLIAATAPEDMAPAAPADVPAPPQAGGPISGSETQAQILLRLAADVELFHSPDGRTFAVIDAGYHSETHIIRSVSFKRWLVRAYFREQQGPPSSEALQSTLGVLEAQAQYDGSKEPVHTRVAGVHDPDGAGGTAIFIDLCDDDWRAVRVNRVGWQVVDKPPVRFRRAKGMLPLPEPVRGGSLDDLRAFVNVGSDDDWRLIVAWLTAALRETGPFPALAIQGEQGSAKSTTSRIFRKAIDPHVTLLRCEPKEPRDLMIGATNSWIQAYDNLSGLPTWLSDALCRLSTGGGFATRTLYENDEETFFDAMRPVLLNGIEDVASRGDLLDRCIALSLPSIPEDRRREEGPFWSAFEAAHPRILGALLDAVAGGLREMPGVKLDRLPRMADFARWGEAVGRGLGWEPGAFLASYALNRAAATEVAMEASPVALAIRELMAEVQTWEGTSSDLLAKLGELVGEKVAKTKSWPTSARGMSGAVRRVMPAIRSLGIIMDLDRREPGGKRTRKITITLDPSKEGAEPSRPSRPSRDDEERVVTHDMDEDLRQHGGEGRSAGRSGESGTVDRPEAVQPSRQPSRNGDRHNSNHGQEITAPQEVPWDGRDGRDGLSPILSPPAEDLDEEIEEIIEWVA